MSYFNVRVYGLLINADNQILISDEQSGDRTFSKFPGGGLEYGEGLADALKREFMEECNMPVEILSHFYTTDFFEQSSFNDSQIISVYYLVREVQPITLVTKTKAFDFEPGMLQSFRWVGLDELQEEEVTFRTDRTVVSMLLALISQAAG